MVAQVGRALRQVGRLLRRSRVVEGAELLLAERARREEGRAFLEVGSRLAKLRVRAAGVTGAFEGRGQVYTRHALLLHLLLLLLLLELLVVDLLQELGQRALVGLIHRVRGAGIGPFEL